MNEKEGRRSSRSFAAYFTSVYLYGEQGEEKKEGLIFG